MLNQAINMLFEFEFKYYEYDIKRQMKDEMYKIEAQI